jgi:nucleoid-associated protein EbfC
MSPRDLQRMQQQMMQMQQRMAEAQEKAAQDLAATILEGSAGGGAVTVAISGDFQVQKVTIDPDAMDPADAGALEDMIAAAMNDALVKVQEAAAKAQEQIQTEAMRGVRLPPGMGLGM